MDIVMNYILSKKNLANQKNIKIYMIIYIGEIQI